MMASLLEAATARFTEMNQRVYGSTTVSLPSTLPTLIETGWNGVSGVTGLSTTDRWTVVDATGQSKHLWLMNPATPSGPVVIFHCGHVGDDPKDVGTKSINMVEDLLAANRRVLAISMPGILLSGAGTSYEVTVGGTTYTVGEDHNSLESCQDPALLRLFIDPVFIAINQAKALFPSSAIHMCGISGGGWTATMCAAFDSRIERSYSVSGCLPDEWMRVCGGNGDLEQWPGAPWRRGLHLDYHHLWALAVSTAGRRQRVLYNDQDPEYSVGELGSYFFPNLQLTLDALPGTWNYTINTGTDRDTHSYSATIRTAILDDMAA